MEGVNKKIPPDSRDYDFKDIDVDPRFKTCKKEMFICFGVFAVFAAAMLICVFVIGGGDPLEYKYLFGMPVWYVAIIAVCIATAAVVAIILDKVFAHMSLEAVGDINDEKKGGVSDDSIR